MTPTSTVEIENDREASFEGTAVVVWRNGRAAMLAFR